MVYSPQLNKEQEKRRRRQKMTKTKKISLFIILLLSITGLYLWNHCLYYRYSPIGKASWYGGKFHGRITANGEIYDMNKLTAAHRYLPFGTKVAVTNFDNNKTVIVRINDRGPYISGRIIDLSRKAAQKLKMVKKGVSLVKIAIIPPDRSRTPSN